MLERRTYPAGVPCWIDTDRRDPAAGMDFYGALFGWEFVERAPVGAAGPYHVARLHGHAVAAVAQTADSRTADSQVGPPVWNTYIAVDDVEQTVAAAALAGRHPVVEAVDVGDAGRMAVMADPVGAAFRIWEARQHHGAVLVAPFDAGAVTSAVLADSEGAIFSVNTFRPD